MRSFYSNCFILFFILSGISCNEKEKPNNDFGTVSFIGIELLNPSSFPSGKISTQNVWEHTYQNRITIQFESSTGQKSNLEIQPNDFSIPYSIELPTGTYSLSSIRSTDLYSDILPIWVNQEITINPGTQSLTLEATSDYGLFTLSNKNLGTSTPLLVPQNVQLFSRDDFFYLYALKDQAMSIRINLLDNESYFRFNWQVSSYSHRHLDLYFTDQNASSFSFSPVDFSLDQNFIELNANGIPSSLSPIILADLETSQNENSGLAYIQNRLFSINDGGNSSEIFELDPLTGKVIRAINVKNSTNKDWEDLAQNDTHLFIGDFGNNTGTRKDLSVLKIPITDVLAKEEVDATRLTFSYSDQSDFSGNGGNHNFDCEAFFFWNDALHLFTKNRLDQKTSHYTLNPNSSNAIALRTGSFPVDGLITGASISPEGNVVLLGYQENGFSSKSFVWLFSDYSNSDFFSGKASSIFIGSPGLLSQTEGIVFEKEGNLFISGERISLGGQSLPARISKIDFTGLF
ncbi:MAG: hypothetical protein P8O16_00810 [Algoriphagus sp.]|uniref:hypothetical protein n=1 Tax=Algoriphagus sp. TaxID=1872435 RepID=UPI00261FD670|nr:hypothetical protein [Algoriphagus sp.]MDG1275786.1 hypothetical protein [Algoriphagus sp.]